MIAIDLDYQEISGGGKGEMLMIVASDMAPFSKPFVFLTGTFAGKIIRMVRGK